MPVKRALFASVLLLLPVIPVQALPASPRPGDAAAEPGGGSTADRLATIERAMWERDPRTLPALREWAERDESEKVRERAIGALTLLRDAGASGILFDRLASDPSPRVRRAAADGLGNLWVPVDRIDRIAGPLWKDPDPMVRAECARALGQAGASRATGVLVYALSADKSSEVRALAAEALSRLGAREAEEALRGAAARDASALVRLSSVRALQVLSPEESRDLFRTLWQGATDSEVRLEAFRGLLLTSEKGAWIAAGMKEGDSAVRLLAFRGWLAAMDFGRRKERLGRRSGEVAQMEAFLKDPARGVRDLARVTLEAQGFSIREDGFHYAIAGE